MQFYVASAVVDKGIGPDGYKAERVDTINGAILSDIVSAFIIIATAAAIGGTGPLAFAHEAALALVPAVGSAAPAIFGVGLLGASLLAAAVVPLSSSYAIAEAVGAPGRSPTACGRRRCSSVSSPSSWWSARQWRSRPEPDLAGREHEIVDGLITAGLLAFVLILANRRSVLGDAANGRVFRAVATVCVVSVGALALRSWCCGPWARPDRPFAAHGADRDV